MEHSVWPNYTMPSNDNIYKWCNNVRSFNVESHGFHNCHVGNNAKWGHKESEDVGATGKMKAYSD